MARLLDRRLWFVTVAQAEKNAEVEVKEDLLGVCLCVANDEWSHRSQIPVLTDQGAVICHPLAGKRPRGRGREGGKYT